MKYPLLNILLVEEDPSLGSELKELLSTSGHRVEYCDEGNQGFETFCNGQFNFCIFDIVLPGIDGYTLAQRIRRRDQSIPIIIISSLSRKEDKRKAFDLGIDDYLVKPFDSEELVWRIRAIKRRMQLSASLAEINLVFSLGGFSFDFNHQLLKRSGRVQRLTRRECEVLRMLCGRKNQLVKRDEILKQLWGDVDYFHGRSLDVFISKLRRYLKSDPRIKIENIPTIGYVLKDESNDPVDQ
ncbi:response regulator transcription factor [Thermophagus sp. OGC60D27]|uniref:response regulator transcription factor n=1 Tax=Thermophagus sp. OGC60D27 TaxID=3458415 RepID=UPI004037C5A2